MNFLPSLSLPSLSLPSLPLMKLVLPSLRTSHYQEEVQYNDQDFTKFMGDNRDNAEHLMIHDRLHAVKYYRTNKSEAPGDQKWVVIFPASGVAYERMLTNVNPMATALKANVLMFNYSGVSKSLGDPHYPSDLIADGKSVIGDLIEREVKMKNILVWGQSIGAGIAAELMAGGSFQEGNFFADRTFCDLPSVASSLLGVKIVGSAVDSVLRSAGYLFDNTNNIKKIKGCKIVANTSSDTVIDFKVSLAATHDNPDDVVKLMKNAAFRGDCHMESLFYQQKPPFDNASEAIDKAYRALHPK